MNWIVQFMSDKPIVRILDILIIWYITYRLLLYFRGTRAINLLKGVGIIIVAKFLSATIGLQTIDWLLGQVISWGVVGTIVLFQPELRKALETLGRNVFRNRRVAKNPSERLIEDLEKSLLYMAKRKIGALISIEATDSLEQYIQSGIPMNAIVSNQLLINIFIPNTPLHDGAVIISDYEIAAAACYLPLSDNGLIPKELGTRHRAAIGLGEVTDALTLIVSEETGSISVVKQHQLHRDVSATELRELLERYLMTDNIESEANDMMSYVRKVLPVNMFKRGDQ